MTVVLFDECYCLLRVCSSDDRLFVSPLELNVMSFAAEHLVTKGYSGVERIRESSFR